jgi:hypothetical protein
MNISLLYGHNELGIDLPVDAIILKPERQVIDPVCIALAAPIGSPPLAALVRPDGRHRHQ